jgi:REP element-mobilizing transposase RayT
MDRFYMFTWRTYGTWLPGQAGFVGAYVTPLGDRTIDHTFGMPTADAMPALARYADDLRKAPATLLTHDEASGVLAGVTEAADRRGRVVHGLAVMPDHLHLMFLPGPNDGADMRRMRNDWKSLVSGSLNRQFGRREWWVRGGSTRWHPWSAFGAIAKYLWEQPNALCGTLSAEATEAMLDLEPRPGTATAGSG